METNMKSTTKARGAAIPLTLAAAEQSVAPQAIRIGHHHERGALVNPSRIATLLCWLTALALPGCSTNPAVPAGGSVQDFARSLDGKKYSFDLSGSILVPSMSGVLATGQRIPKGLLVALAPAQEHCAKAGGESSFTKLQAVGEAQLPLRLQCQRGAAALWALDLTYRDVGKEPGEGASGRKTLLYLNMTVRTQLLPADQFAARLHEEDAQAQQHDKAAAAERERQAALERERQQLTKDKEAEAQRVVAQWPARVAEFRARLKAGDRFKWASPPSTAWGGPFVGMVVRVEGALVFVQFENLTIAGQQTRYVARDQLDPFDGPTPQGRYEIK